MTTAGSRFDDFLIQDCFNSIVKTKDGFMLKSFFINQLCNYYKMKEIDARDGVELLIKQGYFECIDGLHLRVKSENQ
jgi:hypothetical protein